jgi:hypothetical protein
VLRSENEQLSAASLKLLESFRFQPGQVEGEAVRARVEMPITWHPG